MYGSIGPAEMLVGLLLILPLVSLIPMIFYLLTLQNALSKCAPENRAMPPGQVWLMMIPLFNWVWHFIIVNNVATSLGREFRSRGISAEPKPGQEVGTAMCILNLTWIIPIVGFFSGIAGFVCWIVYWVKISNCSQRLGQSFPR